MTRKRQRPLPRLNLQASLRRKRPASRKPKNRPKKLPKRKLPKSPRRKSLRKPKSRPRKRNGAKFDTQLGPDGLARGARLFLGRKQNLLATRSMANYHYNILPLRYEVMVRALNLLQPSSRRNRYSYTSGSDQLSSVSFTL